MAAVTRIILHRVPIGRPRYLLYFIYSMVSTMQQIGYDLQIWFDCRISFAKYFFVSSAHVLFEKREKEEAFY